MDSLCFKMKDVGLQFSCSLELVVSGYLIPDAESVKENRLLIPVDVHFCLLFDFVLIVP